jgi:hypothetical protein
MKLKMHSFDFEECTLTFSVPKEIMDSNGFGNVPGGVEVDLVAITKNAALDTAEQNRNSLQQLKAEIAALATELQDFNDRRIRSYGRVTEIVAKMRQLSAV